MILTLAFWVSRCSECKRGATFIDKMSLTLAFWASEMLRMRAWSQFAGAGVMNLQFTPDWPVRCVFKFIEMLFSKKPNMKQICAVCGQAVCPYSSGNDRTSRRMDAFPRIFAFFNSDLMGGVVGLLGLSWICRALLRVARNCSALCNFARLRETCIGVAWFRSASPGVARFCAAPLGFAWRQAP